MAPESGRGRSGGSRSSRAESRGRGGLARRSRADGSGLARSRVGRTGKASREAESEVAVVDGRKSRKRSGRGSRSQVHKRRRSTPISGEPPAAALFSLPLSPPFPSLSGPARVRRTRFGGRYTRAAALSRAFTPLFPARARRAALSPARGVFEPRGRGFPLLRRPPERIGRLGDAYCAKATP